MMTFEQLMRVLDDLKYLNRLNRQEFATVFFPNNADDTYFQSKWVLFQQNPLHFLWSLSNDKITSLVIYIRGCKQEAGE